MIIHFYLRFSTTFGQTIFVSGDTDVLGNDDTANALALSYFDPQFWHGSIEIQAIEDVEDITYKYIVREADGTQTIDAETNRVISLKDQSSKEIILIDAWNYSGSIENAFNTQPFQQVLLKPQIKQPKLKEPKTYTHQFKVKAPLLQPDEWVCITGSGKMFKDWDIQKLLPLKKDDGWFSLKINLSKEDFPVNYKYGIYNTKNKSFKYEEGSNRTIISKPEKNQLTIIHDGFIHIERRWRGAGVAIPVFSLRSKNSFGTGEFSDIRLLIDWAKQTGLQLLQLLPVNDTISTNTSSDSYPYSAISAFALHPLYINIEKVAGAEHAALIKPLAKKRKQLNQLPDMDYEEVIKNKLAVLKDLYNAKKDAFHDDVDYFEFFDVNRHWLVPYAAFCFLRDKYKTADFNKWKAYKKYNEDAIQRLVSPEQEHYDSIAIYYFIQYHLHLQLKEVNEYAHSKGIILKGDIPIGISRNSSDAWVDPSQFNLNEQAGAPPDDFAVKGQNWGFPTYNWKKMHDDDFAWWRNRFEQMSNYFDAFRIDHILGFFRIWSIPIHAVEGALGRFVPAIPVHISEFDKNRIWFDYNRYCKPFITENILQQQFGEQTNYIKENFLDVMEDGSYQLKDDFNTQRKVEKYFNKQSIENADKIKPGLFNLISNIILIEEEGSQMQQFHFRVSMYQTASFQNLDPFTQSQLSALYNDYFFNRQNDLWKREAMQKLPDLKRSTNMLICGEDLGMVPNSVPGVMKSLGILSLEIQRMPKDPNKDFFHPKDAPYLSVVTPSTHDMSTIRGWWEEDRGKTQKFYNYIMGHYGQAPYFCEPWINKEIILQHLYSPAMWSIFQLQDILGMSEKLRREDPQEERINVPADSNHYWNYRMHITLEDLLKQKEFNKELKTDITQSGRI